MGSPSLWFGLIFKGYRIFLALVAWPLGVRPGLSPEDEEVKQKLVKCASRAYSDLIRSDIPGSSGARLARLPFLRPSPLFVMKPLVSKSSSPFCFGAPYREAYTGRASSSPRGAGKEEEERKAENSDFP